MEKVQVVGLHLYTVQERKSPGVEMRGGKVSGMDVFLDKPKVVYSQEVYYATWIKL
jgi:hypothetical protein